MLWIYVADHFVQATLVTRQGEVITPTREQITFEYRQTDIPDGAVITEAGARPAGEAEALHAKMRTTAQTRRNPTNQGTQRWQHISQPRRIFQHRACG